MNLFFFSIFRFRLGKWVRAQTQTRKFGVKPNMKSNLKIDFRVWVWVRTHLPNPNLKIEKNRVHIPAYYSQP
jgi:hypothetical protein